MNSVTVWRGQRERGSEEGGGTGRGRGRERAVTFYHANSAVESGNHGSMDLQYWTISLVQVEYSVM